MGKVSDLDTSFATSCFYIVHSSIVMVFVQKQYNLLVTFREMPRTELMTDATEIDFFKISKNYVSVFTYSNFSVYSYPVYPYLA